jgi:hypothetical protein
MILRQFDVVGMVVDRAHYVGIAGDLLFVSCIELSDFDIAE